MPPIASTGGPKDHIASDALLLAAHREEFLAECKRQGDSEEDARQMLADFEREHLEAAE